MTDETNKNTNPADENVAPAKKKSKKKLAIIAGIVAAVILIAGVGFTVWHEQPSFCNAICHSPMDRYVEGYESGDSKLLVTVHKNAGNDCLECHDSNISQQLAEGKAWITKDFTDPISPGMTYEDSFCLDCHEMTRADLMQQTEELEFNPHDNRHGDIPCASCHQMHDEQKHYCASCHEDAQKQADELGWVYEKA